jgi:hypothetical protein
MELDAVIIISSSSWCTLRLVCDKVIEGGQVIGVPLSALLLPVTEYFAVV